MSSTGATLSGSFAGATGTISETGFWYGTSSSNLQTNGTKVSNTDLSITTQSGDFTKAVSNLTPNTTYWYLAYVKEYNASTSTAEQRVAAEAKSFKTKAVSTATVTTDAASGLSQTGATLNGSFSGATGTISEVGFEWAGSSATVTAGNGTKVTATGTTSPFNKAISGLTAGTTYYYRAYVKEANESTSSVDTKYGSVVSFTTTSQSQSLPSYLTDYGMPDVSGIYNGLRDSGTNAAKSDDWYSYNTTSSTRQIAVHTYSSTVNYVVLYDETKYAPVWTAHTMNNTTWPRNNVGRNESWGIDPAISLDQQSGVSGYSKGHLVASNYRQTAADQNKQTFYYSNQAPQYQIGFNGGVWETLESRVIEVSTTGTTMLYVITGVLYEGTVSNNVVTSSTIPTVTSGNKIVSIPSHFYKCIMQCTFNGNSMDTAKGIAFIYTNESHSGDNYYNSKYVTSIDAIEQRAGFDFFAAVPDNLEATAEANTNANWFTTNQSNNVAPVGGSYWGTL